MVNAVPERRKLNESVTHLLFEHTKKQIAVLGREGAVQLVVRVHDSLHASCQHSICITSETRKGLTPAPARIASANGEVYVSRRVAASMIESIVWF
jgi:hypothetical protein